MRFLITGTTGFVGFHLARRLLADGNVVVGCDGPVVETLAAHRRDELGRWPGFHGVEEASVRERFEAAVALGRPDVVVHLAGAAHSGDLGDRLAADLGAAFHLLEVVRRVEPKHVLLTGPTATPARLVAAAEASGEGCDRDGAAMAAAVVGQTTEALAQGHARLWHLPITCCRLPSVYGPWAGPETVAVALLEALASGRPADSVPVDPLGDYIHVDDLVEALVRLLFLPPLVGHPVVGERIEDTLSAIAPWRVVDVSGGITVPRAELLAVLEAALHDGVDGPSPAALAGPVDPHLLEGLTGLRPTTPIGAGLAEVVEWWRTHHPV